MKIVRYVCDLCGKEELVIGETYNIRIDAKAMSDRTSIGLDVCIPCARPIIEKGTVRSGVDEQ